MELAEGYLPKVSFIAQLVSFCYISISKHKFTVPSLSQIYIINYSFKAEVLLQKFDEMRYLCMF